MIVRPDEAGFILIDQADHARLAGEFAAHWGNDRFERPDPHASMCVATIRHDDGWILWDAAPKVDPLTRAPLNFPHIAVDEHIALYTRGIAQVIADDALAGLMVNRHCQWLYELKLSGSRSRPLWTTAPTADARGLLQAALRDLRVQHDELVARLRDEGSDAALLTAEHLKHNSMLMQFYDALSLYFCTGPLRDDALGVPVTDGGETATIALRPADDRTVGLRPWPFNAQSLHVSVVARRLPQTSFESHDRLCGALRAAPRTDVTFCLLPA